MIGSFARKFFGSSNDRRIKGYAPRVNAINALEAEVEKLTDDQLRARTEEFRKQVAGGTPLDDLLVPASPRSAKPPSALSASAILTCSSLAAWCCTKARSRK